MSKANRHLKYPPRDKGNTVVSPLRPKDACHERLMHVSRGPLGIAVSATYRLH